MRRAFVLVLGLVGSEDLAWDALRSDSMVARMLLLHVVLPLSATTSLAWAVGTSLMPLVSGAEPAFAWVFVRTFLLCIAAIALLILALVVLLPMYGCRSDWRGASLLASASAMPMLLCGVLLFYPKAVLVMVPAALHAAYLLYSGSQRMLAVATADAAEYSAVVMLLALGLTMGLGAMLTRLGFV